MINPQYLKEMATQGFSSADFKRTTHLLIGCLTHSHDTSDKKMYRVSHRVRKNAVNLLKMGLSEGTIRNKYLRPEAFGGAKAKELSWDHLNMLQRKNFVLPPDPNVTEREGLFRFTHHSSCRALNFKTEDDPTSYNPRHAYDKASAKSKEVKAARVVNVPQFILVFMDENQRQTYIKSPKTLLAIQSRDIFRKNSLYLTTLLVLGKDL